MEGGFSKRLGTFFILVGLGFLVVFIGSAFSRELHLNYFLLSGLAFAVGSILRRRGPRPESGRFGTVRKIQEQRRLRREERKHKEPDDDQTFFPPKS